MTADQSGPSAQPDNPQPQPPPFSAETWREIRHGPLDPERCAEAALDAMGSLVDFARRSGAWEGFLLAALTREEAMHVKRVQLTLSPSTSWAMAFEVIALHPAP